MNDAGPNTDTANSQASEIDAVTLAELTRALLPYLGPYSITTVKRASRATSDPKEAINLVAQHIEDAGKREMFLKSARRVLQSIQAEAATSPRIQAATAGAGQNRTGGRPATPITPELVKRGEIALAPIIGPLASVLVGRYARVAENSRDFFERLASHLRSADERETFFASIRSHAAADGD
jgi:hypothetical protein